MDIDMKKIGRIAELEEQIQHHSDLYYNKNTPEISDAEFDTLVDELRSRKPDSLVLTDVGALPTYGKKIKHPSIMGSLDKETTVAGIELWARKYAKIDKDIVVTPKMDGTSLRLGYENGKLVQAASRGDGTAGMDVLDNVKAMKSVPKFVKGLTADVRCEVYMRKSVFARLRDSGERIFANPRNAASGSLMAKDPKITGSRDLSIAVHDVIIPYMPMFQTECAKRQWMLENMHEFEFVAMQLMKVSEFEKAAKLQAVVRPDLDYQIDGLVVALNSIADQLEAGWSGGRPRGKMAYKFAPEQRNAKVLNIDWQVGRTGKLTPMARIQPTLVDGSTISNITLHNMARVKELDVCVGDIVLLERCGDVIPGVVRVSGKNTPKGSFIYPTKCPVCKGKVEVDENNVSLWCMNPGCSAKLEERVLHYIKTLEITGVGPAVVVGMCAGGYIKDIPDLYELTGNQFMTVTGGLKSGEKAVAAIEAKRAVPLAVFLDSLGIHGLGTTTSKLIAKKYKTLNAVMEQATVNELQSIENIGELTATSIINGLKSLSKMVDKLRGYLSITPVKEVKGGLHGLTFLITGTLSVGRKDMESLIENCGGVLVSSVSNTLNYLILGDTPGSKLEKAKKAGIPIISEAELRKMLG